MLSKSKAILKSFQTKRRPKTYTKRHSTVSRTVENLRKLTRAPNWVPIVITDFFSTRVFNTALTWVHHWLRSWEGPMQSKPSYFIFRRDALLSFFCRSLGFQSYLFLSLFPNKFLRISLPSSSFQTPRSTIPSFERHNKLWWRIQIMQGKMANDKNFFQEFV